MAPRGRSDDTIDAPSACRRTVDGRPTPRGGPPVAEPFVVKLAWTDAETYERELARALAGVRARIEHLIADLGLEPGLVDQAVIRVSVRDLRRREGPPQPLPPGPAIPGVVYGD